MPHECTTCGRQFDDGSKEMLSGCPNCGGNKFQFQPAGRSAGGETPASTGETAASTPTEPADGPTTDASTPDSAPVVDDREGGTRGTDTAGAESEPAGATADSESDDAEIADGVAEENRAQRDARSASASHDEIDLARRRPGSATEDDLSAVGSSARGTPQGPPTDPPSSEESEVFDISGAVGPDDADPVEKQPVGGSTGEPADPSTDEENDLSALREELNDQFESIKITAPGQYELNLMELFDRQEYIISLQEDGRYVIEMAEEYGMEDA